MPETLSPNSPKSSDSKSSRHQVLALKWRPRNFSEVVGQQHVLKALTHALDTNHLHHAYLFSGTRGVGKTTLGRIFAKSLNCEAGITSKPCGECAICRDIDQGAFIDLIEIDAASRTRVEDTREILDNVQYVPTQGRFKVYLIDEVHMLSTHSFNALLKTLEEPPAHVKFLLATTDPQKLPITVLSRCLHFNLKAISREHIVGHLETVLTSENTRFESGALIQVAVSAQGSMRDALTLVDQAVAYGGGELLQASINNMLGLVDEQNIHRLLANIVVGDTEKIFLEINQLAAGAMDFEQVLQDLLSCLHKIALTQAIGAKAVELEVEVESFLSLAQQMLPENVQICYEICLKAIHQMPFAIDARVAVEMAVLRMLNFVCLAPDARAEGKNESEVSKTPDVEKASEALTNTKTPTKTLKEALVEAPIHTHNFDHLDLVDSSSIDSPVAEDREASSRTDMHLESSNLQKASLETENKKEPVISAEDTAEEIAIPKNIFDWVLQLNLLEKNKLLNGSTRQILWQSQIVSWDDQALIIRIRASYAQLLTNTASLKIKTLLADTYHYSGKISLQAEEFDELTAADIMNERKQADLKLKIDEIESQPLVQALKQMFSAKLDPKSVRNR